MAARVGWCMVIVWLAGSCLPAVSAGEPVAERRERVMQSAAEGTAGLRVLQAALADESPLLRRPAVRVQNRAYAGGIWKPVRVDVLDAQGNPAEFSGYYGAAGAASPVRLDLAPNDAPGAWTVRARELASGRTAEVRFP